MIKTFFFASVCREKMQTEPSEAAVGADDEVMNQTFKLDTHYEGNTVSTVQNRPSAVY